MPDTANVVSGPALVKIDAADLAHTQGGITFSLAAQNRVQTVDQYGASAIGIVHLGDEVTVTCPFVEWVIDVLNSIYDPGDQSEAENIGFGRAAGYVYTDVDLQVVPIATSLQTKFVQVYKAIPVGEFEVQFNTESDRIFSTRYTAVVDETKTDGRLLGAIYDGGSS